MKRRWAHIPFQAVEVRLGKLPQRLANKYQWLFGSWQDGEQEVMLAALRAYHHYSPSCHDLNKLHNVVLSSIWNHINTKISEFYRTSKHAQLVSLSNTDIPMVAGVDDTIYYQEFLTLLYEMSNELDKRVLSELVGRREQYHQAYLLHLRKCRSGVGSQRVKPSLRALSIAAGLSYGETARSFSRLRENARKLSQALSISEERGEDARQC